MSAIIIGAKAQYDDAFACRGCEHSAFMRMPAPLPLDAAAPNYSIDKGQPGDLCPPCCEASMGDLAHWASPPQVRYEVPTNLLPLRLFKCRKGMWLVVPGLYDSDPQVLNGGGF